VTWAQRLKRVFNIDIETCAHCGGPVKVIACIEEQDVIPDKAGQALDELNSTCAQELADLGPVTDEVSDEQRQSAVDIRVAADFDNRTRQFSISPYKANYIIYTYNDDPNEDPYQVEPTDFLDDDELKFQVSFKMPIATELFGGDTDLLFAYTSVAWWQALNDDIDNPFRETNYEPEIFLQNFTDADLLGLNFVSWELGLNHQSNGRSQPTSGGWDRAIGSTSIELTDDLFLLNISGLPQAGSTPPHGL
jgi:phospholipase A1